MNIDKIYKMTDKEKDEYLETEASKIIESAAPEKRERLRATHNRARMQVKVSKSKKEAMHRTFNIMAQELYKLDATLKIVCKLIRQQ